MRNTAMSETCTAVSRLLQEGVVFNIYSGIIIGINMPFGIKIGIGPKTSPLPSKITYIKMDPLDRIRNGFANGGPPHSHFYVA